MKKENISNHNSEYEKIKAFSADFFKDLKHKSFKVSAQQHEETLNKLKAGLRDEHFFIVVDMINYEIIAAAGLEEIGFSSDNFTLQTYFKQIEVDGTIQAMSIFAREMIRLTGKVGINFLNPKYISTVPMKARNGDTMFVKRVISAWQIIEKGPLCAYLAEFSIINWNYRGEPINARFIGLEPSVQKELNKQISMAINMKSSQFKNPFSPKEMLILKQYCELDENESLSSIINNDGIKIKISTLNYYNKMILEKGRILFSIVDFRTARDVAKHMKGNGFL